MTSYPGDHHWAKLPNVKQHIYLYCTCLRIRNESGCRNMGSFLNVHHSLTVKTRQIFVQVAVSVYVKSHSVLS